MSSSILPDVYSPNFDVAEQLQLAQRLTCDYLTGLAQSDRFFDVLSQSFGSVLDRDTALILQADWKARDFSALPPMQVLDSGMGTANGAYAKGTQTVYLSRQFLQRARWDVEAIAAVLIEEVGHFVDDKVNKQDTAGDEGAIFSTLVREKSLSTTALAANKGEDDFGSVLIDGRSILVEKNDLEDGELPGKPIGNIPDKPIYGQKLTGVITWKDREGKSHAARDVYVDIFQPLSGTVGEGRTDASGRYSISLSDYEEDAPLALRVFTDNDRYLVTPNWSNLPRYVEVPVSNLSLLRGNATRNVSINPYESGITSTEKESRAAFSIYDAIYVGEAFARAVGADIPTERLDINYDISENSNYTNDFRRGGSEINVNTYQYEDWDVLLHEYSHYLSDIDDLTYKDFNGRPPSGDHTFGQSLIYAYGQNSRYGQQKLKSTRLAWSEGLSDYLAIAAQEVVKTLLPSNLSVTQDTAYTVSALDGSGRSVGYQIEAGTAPNSESEDGLQGEGDEVAIAAILYDIADAHREGGESVLLDPIQLSLRKGSETLTGHKALYEFLNNRMDSPPETLHDVWSALTQKVYTTNAEKAQLGRLFETHSVAPSPKQPFTKFFNYSKFPSDRAISLSWERGNTITRDERLILDGDDIVVEGNDAFEVLVFNEDFSKVLFRSGSLEYTRRGEDLSWELPLDGWSEAPREGEIYQYVVTGSDTIYGVGEDRRIYEPFSLGERRYSSESTGPYWSAPRSFGFSVDSIDVEVFKSGLHAIGSVTDALTSESLLEEVPLIEALSDNEVFVFAERFRGHLANRLDEVNPDEEGKAAASEVKEAIVEAIKDSDLIGDVETDSSTDGTRFNISLSGQLDSIEQNIAVDLGLPGLGLTLNPGSKAKVDIGYDFDFAIGVNRNGQFYFDTPEETDLSLSVSATLPQLSAKGQLGLLNFDIEDDARERSQIVFGVDVDLEDGGIADYGISGNADLNLELKTSVGASANLPTLLTDLNLDWDFNNGKPTVAFNNVRLDAGSFISSFASPLLKDIQSVTQPLQKVTDLLTKEVNLGVKVSMADLIGGSPAKLVRSLDSIAGLVNSVPTRPSGQNYEIALGSFNFGAVDVETSGSALANASVSSTGASAWSSQASRFGTSERAFFSQLQSASGAGLLFPILSDRQQALNLILGKDADLFTYDMPELSLRGEFSTFIPIFGPLGARLGGDVEATADIDFGFDTYGLRKVANGAHASHAFDGLYVLPGSGIDIDASLRASAEINAGIARAGAGGGITGSLDLALNGSSENGRLYLDKFDDIGNSLSASGEISAGLHAYFKVGWGWLSYTKRFKGPQKTLIDWNTNNLRTSGVTVESPFKANSVIQLIGTTAQGTEIAYERFGTEYNDSIRGGNATDFIIGGKGADRMDGGGGFDVVSYVTANSAVEVDLTLGRGTRGEAIGDTYFNIEQIEGTIHADKLRGDSRSNVFDGLAGDDRLYGEAGNDTFLGGEGRDYMDGGYGLDSVSYSVSEQGVNISLQRGTASGGHAQGDRLLRIENIEGSMHRDSLEGNSSNNILSGLDGNDTLIGGGGYDTLTGGAGRDLFKIQGGGRDTITDFDSDRDQLWVDALYFSDVRFVQSGSSTLIQLGSSRQTVATLQGVRVSELGEESFANRFERKPVRRPSYPPDKPGFLEF